MLIKPKTSIKFSGKFHVERLWWFFPWSIIHFIIFIMWWDLYLPTWLYFLFISRRKVKRGKNLNSIIFPIWFVTERQAFCTGLLYRFVTFFPPTPLSGMKSGTSLVCVEWNNLNLMSPKNFPWHFSVWKQSHQTT